LHILCSPFTAHLVLSYCCTQEFEEHIAHFHCALVFLCDFLSLVFSCHCTQESKEPEIYRAIRFGTILENVVFDRRTRVVDFAE